MSDIAEYESMLERHLEVYKLLNSMYLEVYCDEIEMFDAILSKHDVKVKLKKPYICTHETDINIKRFEFQVFFFKESKRQLEDMFTISNVDHMRELVDISVRNRAYPEHYNHIIKILACSELCNELWELIAICYREQDREDMNTDRGFKEVLLEDVSLKEILENVVNRTNKSMEDLKWCNLDGVIIDKIADTGILRSWALSSLREHSDLLEKEIIIKRRD